MNKQDTVDLKESLLEPLGELEQNALRDILLVYYTPFPPTQILKARQSLELLGFETALGREHWKDGKPDPKWKKSIQTYIENLVTISGRDRQAIVLGYFRDFITGKKPDEKWDDYEECQRQLALLYHMLAEPFEF